MKKKGIGVLGIIFILCGVGIYIFSLVKLEPVVKIDTILASENYSYLPVEAKDYIKEVYEETGRIVLTEKNKEENSPYLNPDYVNYLSLREEEKEASEIIPNPYVVDFAFSGKVTESSYPSTYHLGNVNGKNFLTPINNQGSLGLCWAFATLEQAESFLMVQNNTPYEDSTQKFSVRQMDYATSGKSIYDYENEYWAYRDLTDGGSFSIALIVMANGVSLVDDAKMPYDYFFGKKELYEVFNYENSLYEVNSAVELPRIVDSSSQQDKEEHRNIIKESIVKNGGAYVGTGSPTGSCSFLNSDGEYIIIDEEECRFSEGYGPHAMQIIGWDDNYEYSYCQKDGRRYFGESSEDCNGGEFFTKKGVWILRNSWGDLIENPYLGYDSYNIDFHFITSMSSMENRNWDNNYYMEGYESLFHKKINTPEKIEKVKFSALDAHSTYTISVETSTKKYNNIKSVQIDYPGLYTFDLSEENIVLNEEEFKVIVTRLGDSYPWDYTMSVFTSNLEDTPSIKTEKAEIVIDEKRGNEIRVYSNTKNIPSNEKLNYSLYKEGVDYSQHMTVRNNIVAKNDINTTLVFDNKMEPGDYKLKISYKDYVSESDISFSSKLKLEGEGTLENPYLIYTEEDLKQINNDLDAYYLLKNDIDLTDDWTPIGTEENPFSGGFDGGKHTISNLCIVETSEAFTGFFGYVKAKVPYVSSTGQKYLDKTYIKNITFKDSYIHNYESAGLLIGNLRFDENPVEEAAEIYSPEFLIDSVHFIDGSVFSSEATSGVLVGEVEIRNKNIRPYFTINNVYSSVTFGGENATGLIGYIYDFNDMDSNKMLNLTIQNIQNSGELEINNDWDITNSYSPVIGGIWGNVKIDLSNFIITTTFSDSWYLDGFRDEHKLLYIGYYSEENSPNLTYHFENGYYVSSSFTRATEIKDSDLYASWTNFDDYWKMETIDNILRIPVLKDIDYSYTSIVSNIELKKYEEVSLADYIKGNVDFRQIELDYDYDAIGDSIELTYQFDEGSHAISDIVISALNTGETKIRVTSNYDGFDKEIYIRVNSEKKEKPTITYYPNTEWYSFEEELEPFTQQVNALEPFKIEKNRFAINGFHFTGWNTSKYGLGKEYTEEELIKEGIDEDLVLYAQWEGNSYTVIYDANGGVGEMDSQEYCFHEVIYLNENEFIRDGYQFVEWNTKADGTGISLPANAMFYAGNSNFFKEDMTLIVYAQWVKEEIPYTIENYHYNSEKKYISRIPVNTGLGDFEKNIKLGSGYSIEVDTKSIEGKKVIFTGSKTRIRKGEELYEELTNIVSGDVNGDGKINYLDYVTVYNHIQKVKNPNSSKKELINEYLVSADMSLDGKVNYLDYVQIYNKIKELKGEK